MEIKDSRFRMEAATRDCPHGRALAELGNPTDQEINAAAETSYRRGFYQGAAAAIEAVEAGYQPRQLRDWLARLFRWRTKCHRGKFECPEWLGR